MDQPNGMVDCRRGWFVNFRMILAVGLTMAELWSSRPWPSNHRNELALGVAVAVDVPLRRLDGPMTSQQLNVPQRAACLVHDASGAGDEGPTA